MTQQSSLSEEIQALTRSGSVKTASKLYWYNPFLDEEGIVRVGRRWQQTTWDFEMKHPISLGRHYVTQLLVRHYHKKHFHVGVDAMLAFLRQKYWIIGSRKIARSVKNSCVTCKRYDGRPCAEVTAPLPGSRVNLVRPFHACGIDFAVPLFAQVASHDISKVWIAFFVCLQTRAVHLEVVTSLTTEDFILAFRRFAARRGQPNELFQTMLICLCSHWRLLCLWEEPSTIQNCKIVKNIFLICHETMRQQGRTQHSSKVANEPPARNQPAFFFFFFFFFLTEAWFLTNESKANEFDRRSFAKLELRKSRSWSWRTAAVDVDGLGGVLVIHRDRDRQSQGVNVVHKA